MFVEQVRAVVKILNCDTKYELMTITIRKNEKKMILNK